MKALILTAALVAAPAFAQWPVFIPPESTYAENLEAEIAKKRYEDEQWRDLGQAIVSIPEYRARQRAAETLERCFDEPGAISVEMCQVAAEVLRR